MINKKYFIGIIVILLVFGMTVIGCGGDNNELTKNITIINIPDKYNGLIMEVEVYSLINEEFFVYGNRLVSSNTVTVELFYESGIPWKGSGNYILFLEFYNNNGLNPDFYENFIFTNGIPFISEEDFFINPVFYNITSSNTISFNLFKLIEY